MKKIILGGIAAIVIAALAVVNVNLNSQSENLLSDLVLANVEALAEGEQPTAGMECTGIGTINCPLNNQPYYQVRAWGN
jgi:hypothetical protein